MHQIMEDRGLAFREAGRALTVESELPHFVSLNLDDPLATGIVLYYIHDGTTTVGRKDVPDSEPDIALEGNDVLDQHCILEYDPEEENVVLQCCGDATVLVDGVPVEDKMTLKQGVTVQLGQDTMLRFNHPAQAVKLRRERASDVGLDKPKRPMSWMVQGIRHQEERARREEERAKQAEEELKRLREKTILEEAERHERENAAAEEKQREEERKREDETRMLEMQQKLKELEEAHDRVLTERKQQEQERCVDTLAFIIISKKFYPLVLASSLFVCWLL